MADIHDKVAVVTGAGSGVGRAIALALARRGATVVLAGRTVKRLRAVASEAAAANGRTISIACDVSRIDDVERLARMVERQAGAARILVNAAGLYGQFTPIRQSDPRRWIETMMVNTIGPYLACRAFLAGMIESGWGRIINVSSAASFGLNPVNSAYPLSKAALNHFTRQLAKEVEGTGVTANVIHPGEVKTEMWKNIRDDSSRRGAEAEGAKSWAHMVEETGGDPPEKAADVVLEIVDGDMNGRFLWIKDGLQKPRPTWD